MNEDSAVLYDTNRDITNHQDHKSTGSCVPRKYPQVIKYMGSKAAILNFIGAELSKIHAKDRPLVDLFAGAGAISGGFGHTCRVISNDIQEYSAVIASTYLKRANKIGGFDIVKLADQIASYHLEALPSDAIYSADSTLDEFQAVEKTNRGFLDTEFGHSHHLFTRVYSGTWWSAEQCIWIDAIRQVLDELHDTKQIDKADFDFGLTCLLHAMAYCSQGTGHYAQYRDAKDGAGMADINKYRMASLPTIFTRKFQSLLTWNNTNVVDLGHELTSKDYRHALKDHERAVVYADPPYAFVHYSRFYHAMETLVKYDYPQIQHIGNAVVKGRYRSERHQSPFSIRTQVNQAFTDLFTGVKDTQSDLLLSYSNTGMIRINELMELASETFGRGYDVWFDHMPHKHMTMGRRNDRSRQVQETLIVAKRK